MRRLTIKIIMLSLMTVLAGAGAFASSVIPSGHVSQLPVCDGYTNPGIAIVTDSTSVCTAGASLSGGGTNSCFVGCNGNNWVLLGTAPDSSALTLNAPADFNVSGSPGGALTLTHSGQTCSTASCTATSGEVTANAASGNVTVSLPVTNGTFLPMEVCKSDPSSNTVTLTPNGTDTINGAKSLVLSAQYQCARLVDVAAGSWSVSSQNWSAIPGSALAKSGVSAGSYTNTNLTVNAQGQITAASNGSVAGGSASSGSGPAIAQYPSGTGTTVGPATVSGDATIAQGGAVSVTGLHFGSTDIPTSSAPPTKGQYLQYNGTGITGGTPSGGSGNVPSTTAIDDYILAEATGSSGYIATLPPFFDVAAFGASYSTNAPSSTFTASSTTISLPSAGSNDFVAGQGVYSPHMGANCSIAGTPCSSISPPAPTVKLGTCITVTPPNSGAYTISSGWAGDLGVYQARTMTPLTYESSAGAVTATGEYNVTAGSGTSATYTFEDVYPMAICYQQSTPTSGPHSVSIEVGALDGYGGMTAVSSPTTLSSVALAFPTAPQAVNNSTITGGAPLLVTDAGVSGAAGYAYYEKIDSGSYFLDRIVWNNEPTVDEGTVPTTALSGSEPSGFVDWGIEALTAEDIPSTPPSSSLADNWFSTVTSSSGSSVVVANAPSQSSSSQLLYHDDTPAWNGAIAACTAFGGCAIALHPGTTRVQRVASQIQVASMSISGSTITATLNMAPGNSPSWPSNPLVRGDSIIVAGSSVSGDNGTFSVSAVGTNTIQFSDTQSGAGACSSNCGSASWDLNMTITGEGFADGGSKLLAFGAGFPGPSGKWCFAHDTGEGQLDFDGELILSNFLFKSDTSAADCQVHNRTWNTVDIGNMWFNGPDQAPMDHAIYWQGGGGQLNLTAFNFLQPVLLAGTNGILIGGKYDSLNQLWPGELLYPQLAFSGGNMVNVTVDTMVFEDAWDAIGSTNAAITIGGAGGGYVDGLDIRNIYDADLGQECASGAGCAQSGTLANGIGSDVVWGQGTMIALTGSEIHWHDDVTGDSGVNNMPGQGCFWLEGSQNGAQAQVTNVNAGCPAFGIISDGMLDAEQNDLTNILSDGVGIATWHPSTILDNIIQANAAGESNLTRYLIGYYYNVTSENCNANNGSANYGFYKLRYTTFTPYANSLNISTDNICPEAAVSLETDQEHSIVGHLLLVPNGAATPPIAGSCGISPGTPVGTDAMGHIVAGTSTASCTINFGTPFGTAPNCIAQDESTIQAVKATSTTSALTISASTALGGDTLEWHCESSS